MYCYNTINPLYKILTIIISHGHSKHFHCAVAKANKQITECQWEAIPVMMTNKAADEVLGINYLIYCNQSAHASKIQRVFWRSWSVEAMSYLASTVPIALYHLPQFSLWQLECVLCSFYGLNKLLQKIISTFSLLQKMHNLQY